MRKLLRTMMVCALAIILAGGGISTQAIAEVVEEWTEDQVSVSEDEYTDEVTPGQEYEGSEEEIDEMPADPDDPDAIIDELPSDDDESQVDENPDAVIDELPADEDESQSDGDESQDDENADDPEADKEKEEADESALKAQATEESAATVDTGTPFKDVYLNTTSQTPHAEDIVWLANSGISTGWDVAGGKEFRPYANVVRCDMAAFLFRQAKLWGLVTEDWQPSGAASFSDVSGSTPHYREIMWLAESGVSKGWDNHDGTFSFKPFAPVKRGDMAAFLARLYQLKGGILIGGKDFIDVNDSTAHAAEIRWLAAAGVSKGWDLGGGQAEFRPYANVVRADMAAFLHRLDAVQQDIQYDSAYIIEFDANGGTGTMENQIASIGFDFTLSPNAFKRTNYAFNGWNTMADGKGTAYADKASVKDLAAAGESIMLYAQWKRQTYTIKFDANGGTGTMKNQTVNRGASVALTANAFTRANYNFVGWNTKADGTGTAYADKAKVKNIASAGKTITLYAQWEVQTYIVTFEANGGKGVSSNQKKKRGETFTLNKNPFSKDGFIFMAWNTVADGGGTYYYDRQKVVDIGYGGETVTLYAQWVTNNYTIKFDSNGGLGTMADQAATRGVSTKLSKVEFRRENYCFVGWNTERDGSGLFVEPSGYVTNPAPYVAPLTEIDNPIDSSEHPKVFIGDTATLSYTDEVTLYAQWKSISAWFRFDYEKNGGQWRSGHSILTGDDWQWIQLNQFEAIRECPYERFEDGKQMVFAGWNTKPDGTGVPYAPNEVVYNVSGDYDTPDLYAQWEYFDPDAFKNDLETAYNNWRRNNGYQTAYSTEYVNELAQKSAEACMEKGELENGLGITSIIDMMRYKDMVATSTRQLTADELIQLWASNPKDADGLSNTLTSTIGVGVAVDYVNGVYWYALVHNGGLF